MSIINPTTQAAYFRGGSSSSLSITAETVTIPAGVAGTIIDCSLANRPVANALGNDVGIHTDTSIALTSTTFKQEVSSTTLDTELGNGDYWVDYFNGHIHGKKFDSAVSMTANYIVDILNSTIDLPAGGLDVNLTDIAGVAVPNGVVIPTTTLSGYQNTLPTGVYNAAPIVRTEGKGGPLQEDVNGNLNVNDGTLSFIEACTPTFISTQTTTVVRAAPAVLGYLIINNPVATGVVSVYNHSSTNTNLIFQYTTPAVPSGDPVVIPFNCINSVGIVVITATANQNITITSRLI